jgi:hypothetical protein
MTKNVAGAGTVSAGGGSGLERQVLRYRCGAFAFDRLAGIVHGEIEAARPFIPLS